MRFTELEAVGRKLSRQRHPNVGTKCGIPVLIDAFLPSLEVLLPFLMLLAALEDRAICFTLFFFFSFLSQLSSLSESIWEKKSQEGMGFA